jgi:hypothetical protein
MHPVIVAEGNDRHPCCDPEFLQIQRRLRHKAADPVPAQPVTPRPEIPVSRRHPHTAQKMARLPRGLRRDILRSLRHRGPCTDFELEDALHRQHQSVSGARRGLVLEGRVEATDLTRRNRFGNDAIVWTITPQGIASL